MANDEDNKKNETKALRSARERAEEAENEAADAEIRATKEKAAADLHWQKKQVEAIQQKSGVLSIFFGIWGVLTTALKMVGDSVGAVAKVFPPLSAVITGMNFVLDLVEAIFLSQETRNRRVVKAVNAGVGMALTIAAVVLTFNPATAPIGAILSIAAMAIATAKEAFFWYKAEKDLRVAKSQLSALRTKFDDSINNREDLILDRQKLKMLSDKVKQLRLVRNGKRMGFFTNLVSFVGATLLTIFALSAVAALVSNPIGLGIVGVTLLGIATGMAIKSRFFPEKLKESSELKKVQPIDNLSSLDQGKEDLKEEEKNLLHQRWAQDHSKEVHDTEQIVHRFVSGLHGSEQIAAEKKILKSDIDFYHSEEPVEKSTSSVQADEVDSDVDSDKDEKNRKNKDDESDKLNPKNH